MIGQWLGAGDRHAGKLPSPEPYRLVQQLAAVRRKVIPQPSFAPAVAPLDDTRLNIVFFEKLVVVVIERFFLHDHRAPAALPAARRIIVECFSFILPVGSKEPVTAMVCIGIAGQDAWQGNSGCQTCNRQS